MFVIWPDGTGMPSTSNLNFNEGETIANLDLATTGTGKANIYNASAGNTDAVVDCLGYFSAN